MKTLTAVLFAVAAAFTNTTSSLAQGNLVQNGSFEVGNSYSSWTLFSGGLLNLGGAGSGVQCADGNNAVGLGWDTTFYQDLPTMAGQQYHFRFSMADWGPDFVPPNLVSLNLLFGSTSLGTVSFSGVGKTYQNMGWQQFDYTVTASSATTRLTFINPAVFPSGARWPMIDNVVVTIIPEPGLTAPIVLGGFITLLRRRRI